MAADEVVVIFKNSGAEGTAGKRNQAVPDEVFRSLPDHETAVTFVNARPKRRMTLTFSLPVFLELAQVSNTLWSITIDPESLQTLTVNPAVVGDGKSRKCWYGVTFNASGEEDFGNPHHRSSRKPLVVHAMRKAGDDPSIIINP